MTILHSNSIDARQLKVFTAQQTTHVIRIQLNQIWDLLKPGKEQN